MITLSGLEAKSYLVTKEGMAELEQQLADLRAKRRQVATALNDISSQTTDMGALEDSTLAVEQNNAMELDGQIDLLERIIGLAEIIKKPATNKTVKVGATVVVEVNGQERTYRLVGPIEADPDEGKISIESPFGQSLLGREPQDHIEIASPTGQRLSATILRIA